MASRAQVQAFLDRIQRMQALQRANVNTTGVDLSALLLEHVDEVIRMMLRETSPTGKAVDAARVEAILRELGAKTAGMINEGGRSVYRQAFKRYTDTTAKGLPDAFSVFGKRTASRLTGTVESFRGDIAERLYQEGFRTWRKRLADLGGSVSSDFERVLYRADALGASQRETVKMLLQSDSFSGKNLPPVGDRFKRIISGGTMDEDIILTRRAHMIARTEATATNNAAVERWSKEAGFEKFVNANSDPVSPLCKGANAAGAMTAEEWAASEWGWPPRHPNCDSQMIPVPPDAEEAYRDVQLSDVFDSPEEAREALIGAGFTEREAASAASRAFTR